MSSSVPPVYGYNQVSVYNVTMEYSEVSLKIHLICQIGSMHSHPSNFNVSYFRYMYIKGTVIIMVFKKCKGDKGRTFVTQMCMPDMLLYIKLPLKRLQHFFFLY